MADSWPYGSPVVVRHAREAYRWAAPMRVVQDHGDFVALYLQPGSRIARMVADDGSPTRAFYSATRVAETTWGLNHALHLVPAGEPYAIQLFWDEATWAFRCWYINFQNPFHRSAQGFETMDLTLDLVIEPDLTSWQWKDVDEFREGIRAGWYSDRQLQELKASGRQIIERAACGAPPFGDSWPGWRPDPAWQPLALPPTWDVPNRQVHETEFQLVSH